eukprot:TRINITY_DN14160_c0_g1_i1.p1 TRINITY_DN14160_c0_g1~~TRINITY_DN14160_c0_g1_i1.p1  ORF type:complete len:184 (-),score=25.79 TRINITY_DN14160_c0_g1_i1:381-932(-)
MHSPAKPPDASSVPDPSFAAHGPGLSRTVFGQARPPDASSLPLPLFASHWMGLSSASPHGASQEDQRRQAQEGQSAWNGIERCARILRTSPGTEVENFLQDIAGILLELQGDRKLALTLVGARLSSSSRSFLRERKMGLRGVLLCYMADFLLRGEGQDLTVEYISTAATMSHWEMSYQVEVRL